MKKEYLVRTPDGHDYGRDSNLNDCIRAAKRLGTGAQVVELDEFLCRYRPDRIAFEVEGQ